MIFSPAQCKLIFLASLGGALEFYDFVIFGFLAKVISQLFFPQYDSFAALLSTFALFAVGYLIRPLGGILFGHFGDKYGRKRMFVLSVLLMGIPTLLIGLLPSYHQIGILASLLLIALRLLQGLSVGGEVPGAIVYIAETAPAQHRGLACGFIFFGINMGLLLGSIISATLANLLTEQQFFSWGWRIAFLIGGALCFISYFLRKQLTETPFFTEQLTRPNFPLKVILTQYKRLVVKGIAITWLGAAAVSLFFLYLPTYFSTQLHMPLKNALVFNAINIAIFAINVVVMCYLSDKIGRKKVMLIGTLFFLFGSYPLFAMFQTGDPQLITAAGIIAALFISSITGSFACMLAELFPTSIRYSGFAVSYNIGLAIFGGLTPLIATSLIKLTNYNSAPSYYLTFSAIVALLALLTLPETFKAKLSH